MKRLARLWCALTKHPGYVQENGEYRCRRCWRPYHPPPLPRRP